MMYRISKDIIKYNICYDNALYVGLHTKNGKLTSLSNRISAIASPSHFCGTSCIAGAAT